MAEKKKRPSLSLSKKKEQGAKCFAEVPEELKSCKGKAISKNTERSQVWALNVFCSWNGSLNDDESLNLFFEKVILKVYDILS